MKAAWSVLPIMLLPLILAPGCGKDHSGTDDAPLPSSLALHDNWFIHSSEGVLANGEAISTESFQPTDWYPATVPSTVVAALVDGGVYPDPAYGDNLRTIPGNNPFMLDVSKFPMPLTSPFRGSWWYRTEFQVPADYRGRSVWLHFGGINFRANIWFNGEQLASSSEVAGTFRDYDFNISALAKAGQKDFLAVEVFPQEIMDLGYNWVDWGPTPPDKNMGIWREVLLSASGPVALRHAQVVARPDVPGLATAAVTVATELVNGTDSYLTATVKGEIETAEFAQSVSLAPHETKVVEFTPQGFPQLNISRPRIWWPARLGSQELYEMKMTSTIGGVVSDSTSVTFGIREITSYLSDEGFRVFSINGKNLFVRGGAWSPDILLRQSDARDEADVNYLLDLGLNTVRLEGKPVTKHFLDLCDRYGILVMAGWCCCDHWEEWQKWDDEDMTVAAGSVDHQIRVLRNHPSALMWLNGSDNMPPPEVESMYNDIIARDRWPNPVLSSAKDHTSVLTGPSGVKMTGPYNYVPPIYWYVDRRHGGAFGFNTETGPGPAIPPVETLRKFIPKEHLWPIDYMWNYHCARGFYPNVNVFTRSLDMRYGASSGVEEYAEKAQVMAYDDHRAMFEAYSGRKYYATGIVQWMLNNQWPSMTWHLYDYYLRPGGAYFGAKKANEMLHVQYSYDDGSILVVNHGYEDFTGLVIRARVLNLDLTERFSKDVTIDVPADGVVRALTIPDIANLSTTYFLKLTCKDDHGADVSENFYWLSTQPVRFLWLLSTQLYVPVRQEADMTQLASLQPASLDVIKSVAQDGDRNEIHVSLANSGASLAFFLQLRVTKGQGGDDVVPILWQDNYVTLLPGEVKQITGSYRRSDLDGAAPSLEISGWNFLKTMY